MTTIMAATRFSNMIRIGCRIGFGKKFEFLQKRWSSHFTFTLEKLAFKTMDLYKREPGLFKDIQLIQVEELVNRIQSGSFQLKPFTVKISDKKDDLKKVYPSHHILYMKSSDKNLVYGCIIPDKEDRLVLMALGLMLNQKMHQMNLHKSSECGSFGFVEELSSYYKHISSFKKPISRAYLFDMNVSFIQIKKDDLYRKISHLIENEEILTILYDFLHIQFIIHGKLQYIDPYIPFSDLISDVLLNYCLYELDNMIHMKYPSIRYSRYIHEIVISIPEGESLCVNDILSVISFLNLSGKYVTIDPGSSSVKCYHGGIVSISKEGILKTDYSP